MSEVVLHSPDAHNPSIDLKLDNFMGTWHVTHSTLPLWKSRKDVTITYAPKPPPGVRFDDIVEYRSKSDPATSTPSRVVGIDTLIGVPGPSTSRPEASSGSSNPSGSEPSQASAPEPHLNPNSNSNPNSNPNPNPNPAQTRFKWRGKGLLMIATSRWQLLGCSADTSSGNDAAWAVTYFEKTMFTPAGLDIYSRTPQGLPDAVVQEIIGKAKGLGGEVARLAENFFEVERSTGC